MADRPGAQSDTARLEMFSDGVIAIAITLLILDIDLPHVPRGGSLTYALAEQWPQYAAYAVSFITIGVIWVNHHVIFRLIERSNDTFLLLNIVFLMTIAFLPWPTALLAEHVREPAGRTVATLVYGGTFLGIALMFNVVWRYATRRKLLASEVDPAVVRRINASFVAGPTTYVVAMLLALVNPWISLGIYLGLAVFFLLPVSHAPAS